MKKERNIVWLAIVTFFFLFAIATCTSCSKWGPESRYHDNDKKVTVYYMEKDTLQMSIDGDGARDIFSLDTIIREGNATISPWFNSTCRVKQYYTDDFGTKRVRELYSFTMSMENWIYKDHAVTK